MRAVFKTWAPLLVHICKTARDSAFFSIQCTLFLHLRLVKCYENTALGIIPSMHFAIVARKTILTGGNEKIAYLVSWSVSVRTRAPLPLLIFAHISIFSVILHSLSFQGFSFPSFQQRKNPQSPSLVLFVYINRTFSERVNCGEGKTLWYVKVPNWSLLIYCYCGDSSECTNSLVACKQGGGKE